MTATTLPDASLQESRDRGDQLRQQLAHGAAHARAVPGDVAEDGFRLRHIKSHSATVLLTDNQGRHGKRIAR
jgi:hypothetical protein